MASLKKPEDMPNHLVQQPTFPKGSDQLELSGDHPV